MLPRYLFTACLCGVVMPIASGADRELTLTRENAKANGYWVRCVLRKNVVDHDVTTRSKAPSEMVSVIFRLGLVHAGRLHEGPFAVNQSDLHVIRSLTVVLRDGNKVICRIPLRTEIDAGNEIHLLAEFSARQDAIANMHVEFEERVKTKSRPVLLKLRSFIEGA